MVVRYSFRLLLVHACSALLSFGSFLFAGSVISNATSQAINSYSASCDNSCAVGGDGGCRVGEVRAGTTSPMPDHKGFKLQ